MSYNNPLAAQALYDLNDDTLGDEYAATTLTEAGATDKDLDTALNQTGVVASSRIATMCVHVIRSTKGFLRKDKANDLMVTRLASDYMLNTRKMRPTHVAQTLPLVLAQVYLPFDTDIIAAEMSTSNQFANVRYELAKASGTRHSLFVSNYRQVDSTPTSL